MPVPIGKADSSSPRKLFSYPAFAAISPGTRTLKYREIFEPRIEPAVSQPRRNPLCNENLIIIEIAEYPDGISRAKREPWKATSQALRDDELPKPDTVRQVRLFFESAAARCNASSAPAGLKSAGSRLDGPGKYNRSSLEKILLHSTSHPKLVVPGGLKTGSTLECGSNSKSFIYTNPQSATMRWPSFKEHGSRPSSLRSGSSSRHGSTDTESSICGSSDDFHHPGDDDSVSRHNLFDKRVEGQFVSPDIMEKLRSCGRSYRFIDGRMIDDKGNEIERARLDPLQVKIYTRSYKNSLSSSGASSADDDSRSSSPCWAAVRNSSSTDAGHKMVAGTCVERQSYGTLSSDFGFL